MTEPILEGVGYPILGEGELTCPGSPGGLRSFDEYEGKIDRGSQSWVGDRMQRAYLNAPIALTDQTGTIDGSYMLNPWINQHQIRLIG